MLKSGIKKFSSLDSRLRGNDEPFDPVSERKGEIASFKMRQKIAIIVCFLLLGAWPANGPALRPALAQTVCPLERKIQPKGIASLDRFREMAVLHEGRIKPVDTYARTLLLQFSGRTSFDKRPAVVWLARLLFAPDTVQETKVFLINNPEIAAAIGIEPESGRRYSFSKLDPGLEKLEDLARLADRIAEKERTVVEREVLRLYANVLLYVRHAQVFSFAFPSADFQIADKEVVSQLDLPAGQTAYSFYDLASRADILHEKIKALDRNARALWSDQEKEFFRLISALYHWSMFYNDLPFTVIPAATHGQEVWLSPKDAINHEFYDTAIRQEISFLRDMAVHYWNGDQLSFDLAARSLKTSVAGRAGTSPKKSLGKLSLELFYNKANFLLWAKLFYGLAFFVFLSSFFSRRTFWRALALAFIVMGAIPHVYALGIRAVIMGRPPVSTLFETFVFVSLVSVVLGIIIELVNRRWLGNVTASVCGLVFLLIAGKFGAEGDTLQMLAAVLNSNFWLGCHVITITIGYAGVCVAGLIGHLYILQGIRFPKDKMLLEATYGQVIGALGFGLMMTFLGTALGGIWADQSWGRFWGWDPKENGALLIILWCAIVLHAKVGRLAGPLGVAVGSVLGIMVVMWAWFGVNLLGVGLHSYGFTSGVASGLLTYVVCELIFLAVSVPLAQRRLINARVS